MALCGMKVSCTLQEMATRSLGCSEHVICDPRALSATDQGKVLEAKNKRDGGLTRVINDCQHLLKRALLLLAVAEHLQAAADSSQCTAECIYQLLDESICCGISFHVGLAIVECNDPAFMQDHLVVTLFLSTLIGSGGNAGNQSAIKVIRGLVRKPIL